MKDKYIIAALLIIVVVLAAGIGAVLLNQTHEKQPVKIKITSDSSQYEDDAKVELKLTDLNGTSVSDEIVNITITDSKGKVVVDDVVKTNSKGSANLKLDLKKGSYTVNVTYDGNDNYTSNSTVKKISIKEEEVAATPSIDTGAFYSPQAGKTIYTGEIQDAPDGHKYKHLGNNQWQQVS